MRILYLITRSDCGGAQNHVATLLRGLSPEFELFLATSERGFLTRIADATGVPVYTLPHLCASVSPVEDLRALADISRLIGSLRPDLIHVHSSKAGLLGRLAAAFRRTPVIFTVHGWSFAQGFPALRKLLSLPSEWVAGKLPVRS